MGVQTVLIHKVKRPRGSGLWAAYQVADDDHGQWLYSPAGSRYRGESGAVTAECEVGQGDLDAGVAVVQLMPRGGWWTATWSHGDVDYPISVDICTPPCLNGDVWTYDDLELDPLLDRQGSVRTYDEDEFAEACERGVITAHERAMARVAADDLENRLRQRIEPFGRVGWDYLDEGRRLHLRPLRELPQ